MKHLVIIFFVLGTNSLFGDSRPITDGLCTYDKTIPNLPRATCFFPPCTPGSCQPPAIVPTSVVLEFPEDPVIQMKDVCPDKTIAVPCWESFVNVTLHVTVQGTPVAKIGLNFEKNIDGVKSYSKIYAKTDPSTKGDYHLAIGVTAHVPQGKRMDIGVFEVCASDATGNEGCVIPQKAPARPPLTDRKAH